MQYFKHFSDVRSSESMAILEEKLGFEGVGRYWRMMEYLVQNFDGDGVSFRLHRRNIRELLRLRSWNSLETFLECFANVRGIKVERSGNVFEIEAPILLELQSRDFKKARKDRAPSAPKIKSKDKDKDKELDKDKEKENIKEKFLNDFVFERIKKSFKQATGIGALGNARTRLENLITSEEVLLKFLKAIENYGKVLEIQSSWRRPKGTLAAFVGSPQAGFSWEDFQEDECVEEARTSESRKNSIASQKVSKSQQLQDTHQILFDQIKSGEIEA